MEKNLTCAFDLWTGLVRATVAVRDPVAFVALVDALFEVVAFELGRRARDGRAVLLVRVVEAV